MFDPSPRPSPGEGETLPASWKNSALDSQEGQPNFQGHAEAVPSPGGEGQGEGGASNQIAALRWLDKVLGREVI